MSRSRTAASARYAIVLPASVTPAVPPSAMLAPASVEGRNVASAARSVGGAREPVGDVQVAGHRRDLQRPRQVAEIEVGGIAGEIEPQRRRRARWCRRTVARPPYAAALPIDVQDATIEAALRVDVACLVAEGDDPRGHDLPAPIDGRQRVRLGAAGEAQIDHGASGDVAVLRVRPSSSGARSRCRRLTVPSMRRSGAVRSVTTSPSICPADERVLNASRRPAERAFRRDLERRLQRDIRAARARAARSPGAQACRS